MKASVLSTNNLASLIKTDTPSSPRASVCCQRLFATMVKAKNHKLNKFLIFPLERKSCNPTYPKNTEKSGNKGFVDLKCFTILKYFSIARKKLRRYVCMIIRKHTYIRWFVGKAVRAAREAGTIGGRSLFIFGTARIFYQQHNVVTICRRASILNFSTY